MLVPGLLTFVLLASVITPRLTLREAFSTAETGLKTGTSIFIAVVIIGCVYRIVKINGPLLKPHLEKVNDNIKDQLLALMLPGTVSPDEEQQLRSSRALMDVFYKLVDKDPTLKVRAGRVYENGAKLTSVIDAALIGLLGSLTHLVEMIARSNGIYFRWWLTWSLIFLVCWIILLPLVVETHIELSNEQLGFIAAHYAPEVRTDVERQLQTVRP